MKVNFECIECKAENEFDTEGQKQILLELKTGIKKTTYIVECQLCGTENRIRI